MAGTKRNRYCTHIQARRSSRGDRCFKTNAEAVRFCQASADTGRCCEVYGRKGGGRRRSR